MELLFEERLREEVSGFYVSAVSAIQVKIHLKVGDLFEKDGCCVQETWLKLMAGNWPCTLNALVPLPRITVSYAETML